MTTTTPPVTPVSEVRGRTAAAIAAQRAAQEGKPTAPAAPAPEASFDKIECDLEDAAVAAPGAKRPKLDYVFVKLEGNEPLKDAVYAAAQLNGLSPANWMLQLVATNLGIVIEEPVKVAKTAAEKALAKSDDKMLGIVLMRDFLAKMGNAAKLKKAEAELAAYVKKLSDTEGIGAEKAAAILAATEKKAGTPEKPAPAA